MPRAFTPWTGARSLLVDVQGHGRQDIFQDVDLTRTVGWFSTLHPVRLELPRSGASGDALRAVKERLRDVPANGIGYGMLRYLSPDAAAVDRLRALPQAQVSFNYLGSFHVAAPRRSTWHRLDEEAGEPRSPRGERSHLIDVRGALEAGTLSVSFAFSERVHRPATLEALAKEFAIALRTIIRESS
jgi:non-ribosomal peptide synthase protein (TIGR01720 family)